MRYLPLAVIASTMIGGCVYGVVSLEHGALIPIAQALVIVACVTWSYLRGRPKKSPAEK